MNWYEILAGILSGGGLIGCIVAAAAYHIRSMGAWRRYPEGRWFMVFFANMGTVFAVVLSVQLFGDWSGRRVVSLVAYVALVGLVWGAVRLLFGARKWLSD